ncbi:MAG: hypothetical protein R3D89_07180 [Sphingomonadaceae bacterium]
MLQFLSLPGSSPADGLRPAIEGAPKIDGFASFFELFSDAAQVPEGLSAIELPEGLEITEASEAASETAEFAAPGKILPVVLPVAEAEGEAALPKASKGAPEPRQPATITVAPVAVEPSPTQPIAVQRAQTGKPVLPVLPEANDRTTPAPIKAAPEAEASPKAPATRIVVPSQTETAVTALTVTPTLTSKTNEAVAAKLDAQQLPQLRNAVEGQQLPPAPEPSSAERPQARPHEPLRLSLALEAQHVVAKALAKPERAKPRSAPTQAAVAAQHGAASPAPVELPARTAPEIAQATDKPTSEPRPAASTEAAPAERPTRVRAALETARTIDPAVTADPAPRPEAIASEPRSLTTATALPTAHAAAKASADAPLDFTTLVDRLAQAREDAAPQTVRTAIRHAEFGTVNLQFRSEQANLSVTMASADPDFAPAVQAAAAAAMANNGGSSEQNQPAPQRHDGQPQAQSQTQANANSDSPSNRALQRGEQADPRRSPASNDQAETTKPETNRDTGIFA